MPYVDNLSRQHLQPILDEIEKNSPETVGELNYIITKLCIQYYKSRSPSYAVFNGIVGALECAKMELYRRAIAEYENQKIKENGDVY